MDEGIRAIRAPTSAEGLNFVVPSDELRRKTALRRRKAWVVPYEWPLGAAMVVAVKRTRFRIADARTGGRPRTREPERTEAHA
jgi:hypothetical protein